MTIGVNVQDQIDPEVIEDLNSIRQQRLTLARSQLFNLNATLEQMIERGLVSISSPDDRLQVLADLECLLKEKVKDIAQRLAHPTHIYEDEIDFLSSLTN
jgi:hypothetical protein